MSEFKKISRWISEIEQNLQDMRKERAETEARIAKRINRIVLDAVTNEFWLPQDKVALCNRLNRMARLLEAEDKNMSTLKEVEKEVEKIYGDQSDNSTYYFSGKSASDTEEEHGDNWYEKTRKEVEKSYGNQSDNSTYYFNGKSAGEKEKKEMEDLTTYDEDNPQSKEVRPEKDHEVVQKELEKDKKSSWSDFAQTQVSFEDDGDYIDDEYHLEFDHSPDEYDYDPKDPLDDF